MTAELASASRYEEQPSAKFDLAAHIANCALNDPTYSIDYIHPDLVLPTAEKLQFDERLDIRTPVIYTHGSNIGRLTLRVNAARAPLAEVIEFPNTSFQK